MDMMLMEAQSIKSLTIGEQKTNLEPVIEIPWPGLGNPGDGVDAITGGITGSAIKKFTPKEFTIKSSNEKYRFIQNERDVDREIEISASGKYNIWGVKIGASMSYLNKLEYSETAITLVAQYESRFNDYDEAESYELTAEAKKLMSEPEQFRRAYGDYFISGGMRVARFTAIYNCTSKSVKEMNEFKASLNASAPDVFSAEGSTGFKKTASQHNISIASEVIMEGYTGESPTGPWTPENIPAALAWFKQHEKGTYFQAKLKHYSTVVPTYLRLVNVEPDVFVLLRKLYTVLWHMRARYNACPEIYQKEYGDDYVDIDTGVVANQDRLPTDLDKLSEYQRKLDILRSELDDVLERRDFYYKVLEEAATEPRQGVHNGGSSMWRFGFVDYNMSNAVVINKQEMKYCVKYKIGYREADIGNSPDDSVIIVGWDVVSHRHNNGHWQKAVSQILGTNQAKIHVKSEYDRGCHWSLVAYYVNARDYLFGPK
jgi:hypothetical protein